MEPEYCLRCRKPQPVEVVIACGATLWKCVECGAVLDQEYDDPSDWDVAMYGLSRREEGR